MECGGADGQLAQAILGKASVTALVDGAEADWAIPVMGQLGGVAGIENIFLAGANDQARGSNAAGRLHRRRRGDGRVDRGDGGDLLIIQGAKHGRTTAHAVANHAELARGNRNIASAKFYPSGNLQRGFHIRGQVAVVGEGAGLRIGGYHDDAPAG